MRTTTQLRTQRRAENALIKKALKVLEDRLEYERKPCPTWCEPEQGSSFQPGMSLKQRN